MVHYIMFNYNKTEVIRRPHLVVTGHIRDSSIFPCQVVLDLVDGIILTVDGTDQHVVGDVIQVAAELQPRSCSTDVVSGAFALHLWRQRSSKHFFPKTQRDFQGKQMGVAVSKA